MYENGRRLSSRSPHGGRDITSLSGDIDAVLLATTFSNYFFELFFQSNLTLIIKFKFNMRLTAVLFHSNRKQPDDHLICRSIYKNNQLNPD